MIISWKVTLPSYPFEPQLGTAYISNLSHEKKLILNQTMQGDYHLSQHSQTIHTVYILYYICTLEVAYRFKAI